MASQNTRLSSVAKYALVIGITSILGVSLGALAVVVFQFFVTEPESRRQGHWHPVDGVSPNRDSLEKIVEVGQFQEFFKYGSIATQYTALYATLSLATEEELKDWWTQSQKIERKSHRETAQNTILRELAKINPQEALSYVDDVSIFQTDSLLITVFSEWAVADLDEAVEAIATLSGQQREIALIAILEVRDDLSNSELRSIAVQLGKEELYLKLVSDTQASLRIEKPQESWDLLLNDKVDDSLQLNSLAKVAETWHAQIGFEVLSHALAVASDNRERLLRSIVQLDPPGAMDYVRGVDEESDKQFLASTVALEWARTDAQGALDAVSTIQPPTLASRLESLVARTWAYTKPNAVIENIELISEEFRMETLENAFSRIADKDPKGAIEKLSSVEHQVGNTSSIVRSILYKWSDQAPDAAADWVLSTYPIEDPQRRKLLEPVLRDLVHQDPSKAFEIAVAQPISSHGYGGLEVVVMQGITGDGDIGLAKKLLPQVREGTSKTQVYSLIGGAMVEQSKFAEALDFGQELSESEQPQYYGSVLGDWTEKDPKNLFASLESLPSDSIQSLAAFQLVRYNQYTPVLTDDQVKHARTFLNTIHETHLKRIEDR